MLIINTYFHWVFRIIRWVFWPFQWIFQQIYRFYWGRGIAYDVPALSYYLLLSLVPFVLGLSALATVVLHQYVSDQQVAHAVARFIPSSARSDVLSLITQTRRHTPVLLGSSILSMLWTTSGAIGVIERSLRRQLDQPSTANGLVSKIRQLVLGGAFALLFILAVAAGTFAGGVFAFLHLNAALLPIIFFFVDAIGSITVIAGIFHFAVRPSLSWKAAFTGALFSGVGLQLLPPLLGIYVSRVNGLAAERIFLVIAGLLFGFFILSITLLAGGGICTIVELRSQRTQTPLPASADHEIDPAADSSDATITSAQAAARTNVDSIQLPAPTGHGSTPH